MRAVKWAYGVTTCVERRDDLLPRTLASLAAAGFPSPRLFVDGAKDGWEHFGLETTYRYPTIRIVGNFLLGLAELWIRDPQADRFALFQDDILVYRNLRQYLDACPFPDGEGAKDMSGKGPAQKRGYLNLYTFCSNDHMVPSIGQTGRRKVGWHLSNQFGRGAVGLVFCRACVIDLLTSREHIVERPLEAGDNAWKKIDGGVISALNKRGWVEYIHWPSLTAHTGLRSTVGNKPHRQPTEFRGEGFDAMELLKEG